MRMSIWALTLVAGSALAQQQIKVSYQPALYWSLPYYIASEKGWWESYKAMGDRQAMYANLEAGANTIREFQQKWEEWNGRFQNSRQHRAAKIASGPMITTVGTTANGNPPPPELGGFSSDLISGPIPGGSFSFGSGSFLPARPSVTACFSSSSARSRRPERNRARPKA